MRSHTLHAALRQYVEEVSFSLGAELADGAEVPFELVEERGARRTALYCYRPLVDEFLRERLGALGRLDGHGAALRALAGHDGVARYLKAANERVPGDPSGRAQAALGVFLARVFAEQTDFAFDADRFDRAYRQLEDALFAGRTHAAAIVPVLGLDIGSEEIVLAEGLTLARVEALPDAPSEATVESDVVAMYRAEVEDGGPDPFVQAGRAFRRLLVALRLYDQGGIALGPVAWARVDEGAWRAATLGAGGVAQGLTLVEAEEEDELRAFCSLVARRTPRSGELAWALGRYGMACERPTPADALSDVLLALLALLEPEGAASGRLPGRLAALCAPPEARAELAERAAEAVRLERAVIAGTAPHAPAVDELIVEMTGHLRALLRDVLCGHLDADVRGLADRLLMEAPV
ncbi:MAG TPA: hypothetical protein VIL49_14115 [Capillimicrobium sp.]